MNLYTLKWNGKGKWHWFDVVFVVIRTSWYILALQDLYKNPNQFIGVRNIFISTGLLGLVTIWLTVCFLVPLIFYFSKKLMYLSPFVELVLLGSLFLFLASEETSFQLYNLPVFTVGYFCFRLIYTWLYIPTVILVPVMAGVLYDYPFTMISNRVIDNTIMFAIGVCFRTMISSHFKMKEMVNIIQEQNKTLENYSKQIEHLTIMEERNRLASELHDTVGHTFTSTILGMEAVYHQMEQSPKEAKEYLKKLAHYAREGYSDVRRNIHQIATQEDEKPLINSLTEICDDFTHHTGALVHFNVCKEAEHSQTETVKLSLIRCLQEALTNAKRHGQASEITVDLTLSPQLIRMSVKDNGTGVESIIPGFGLTSMENRMKSVNGRLQVISNKAHGTIVTCEIQMKTG